MATGDDLELGGSNSANHETFLAASTSFAPGFHVTNSGSGSASNPLTAVQGQAVGDKVVAVRGLASGEGIGVAGESSKGSGVKGKATGGTGVLGEANAGIGVSGTATGSNPGVRGFCNGGHGVHGKSGANRRTVAGVFGESEGSNGVRGVSRDKVGVLGESDKAEGVWGTGGLGVRGDGGQFDGGLGVFGISGGVGVWGAAPGVGVLGSTAAKSGFAGFFEGNVRINGDLDVVGAKNAAVPFPDGSLRRMYSMESPESWFEDFGEERLVKGKAEVTVDPSFGALVRGPYHIFITPYGDSNGLYVSRRERRRFVVREQKGGTSTLSFSYRIVARRKDIVGVRLQKVAKSAKRALPKRA